MMGGATKLAKAMSDVNEAANDFFQDWLSNLGKEEECASECTPEHLCVECYEDMTEKQRIKYRTYHRS
jgi:hypothetical protein